MFTNRKIILIILLLIIGSAAAYFLLVVIPRKMAEQTYDGARRLGKDLQQALQFTPEVRVNNVVILQQQTKILELATLSQRLQHTHTWSHTRLGSTKQIKITGSFVVKAGFDLKEKVSVTLSEGHATLAFPNARLLSLELQPDVVFEDENGMWNWIDEQDRSDAINAFTGDARRIVSQGEYIRDANRSLEQQMTAVLRNHVDSFDLTIGSEQHHWERPATGD